MEAVPIDGGGGLRAQICTVAALNSNVAAMPEESSTLQELRPGLVLQRERQEHAERGEKAQRSILEERLDVSAARLPRTFRLG